MNIIRKIAMVAISLGLIISVGGAAIVKDFVPSEKPGEVYAATFMEYVILVAL